MSFFTGAVRRTFAYPLIRFRSVEERIGIVCLTLAILFATSQSLLAHDYKIADIRVDHPWSRATPDGARVAAGYLVVANDGAEADRLIAVTAEIAGRAEIHEMTVDAKGVMTMRPVGGVEVPAGGEVALEPGGYHIMFMDLQQAPKEGERFAGTLTFEKAGTVDIEFAVDAMGGGSAHDAHGGHGG